jgi:ElaB/YqjD/DUF883 family membrane-anchored ribosome-binding protein
MLLIGGGFLMYTKDTRHTCDMKHNLHNDLRKVKAKIFETRDALTQTAHDAREHAGELFHHSLSDMKDRSEALQDNVVSYVKSNPAKAFGFAVIAGLITALILRK